MLNHSNNPQNQAYPLSFCRTGSEVIVKLIIGCPGAKSRLEALGFIPGERITVVSGSYSGPFVIRIKDCQLALGKGMLNQILVS